MYISLNKILIKFVAKLQKYRMPFQDILTSFGLDFDMQNLTVRAFHYGPADGRTNH